MSLEWEQVVVEARDPVALGQWWREALGWIVVNDDPDAFEIRPQVDRAPRMIFEPVDEPKRLENRLHLDFRPDDQGSGDIRESWMCDTSRHSGEQWSGSQ